METVLEPILKNRIWFVFQHERHEGPYSAEEIFQRLDAGVLKSTDQVWKAGMAEWVKIQELPGSRWTEIPSTQRIPAQRINKTRWVSRVARARDQDNPWAVPLKQSRPDSQIELLKGRVWNAKGAFGGALFLVFALSGGFSALLNVLHLGQSHAGGYVLSKIEEVNAEDEVLLRATAAAAPAVEGYKVSLAISKAKPQSPTFYLATNAPEKSVFEVVVEGVPDTLVGKFRIFTRQVIEVSGGLAKSAPFTQLDGSMLPKGEYRIYALEQKLNSTMPSLNEVDLHNNLQRHLLEKMGSATMVSKRSYFLGGPKNTNYDNDLRQYHERIRELSKMELEELSQFASTLSSQLKQSEDTFRKLSVGNKHINRVPLRWELFDQNWQVLQEQLSESTKNWNEAALLNDIFHAELYATGKQLALQLQGYHQQLGGDLKNGLGKTLGEGGVALKAGIESLKTKIAIVAQLAPSANGMPQK